MNSNEEKKTKNYLTHSLTGNTSGSNNVQTVVDILNQTTMKPVSQSVNVNQNQSKKVGE